MTAINRTSETVLGLVPRAQLPSILSAVHAAGLGRQVSVVDPERGDVPGRLKRLGITGPTQLVASGPDCVLVVVPAPGRIAPTEALLLDRGATAVERHGRLPAREHGWFTTLFGGDAGDAAAT
jgi:hypothetical protein